METMKLEMILSSNGRTLPMGKGYDFDIERVTGLESTDFKLLFSDIANSDGDDLIAKKLGRRPIHIEASLRDNRLNKAYRNDVIKFFNPNYPGKLYVNYMGIERQIEYEIEGWTFAEQENLWQALKIVVDLTCPDPYMLGLDTEGVKFSKQAKLFAFPYVTLDAKMKLAPPMDRAGYEGTVMSYRIPKSTVEVINDGDVATGYVIRMKAVNGGAVNPIIANSVTHKRMSFKLEMEEGDILVITVTPKVRTIKLNGENAYHRIDRSSSPFMLEVGSNMIEFFAEEGFANLDIDMTYSLRYMGV